MLDTIEPATIFADAHAMQEAALERLAAGDIRDAAEKAWCATLRATDALILIRTGHKPEWTSRTSRGIQRLANQSADLKSLGDRYFMNMGYLHGNCFYDGNCEPEELIEQRIRETADYIRDAEALASG